MKKRRFLLPKISGMLCTQSGQINWFMGFFCVLILLLLICTGLQLKQYQVTSGYMEDALAASNLASAVVDLLEYGISHKIQIQNPLHAYEIYCHALKGNLNLDDAWQCRNTRAIAGPVRIVNYIIYNVADENVKISMVKEDGSVYQSNGSLGTVKAPNGVTIENTSIYSEITCPVRGIWNLEVMAEKGKLVDIVAEGNEL